MNRVATEHCDTQRGKTNSIRQRSNKPAQCWIERAP